jgi:SAM-dependent methyltransferase
MSGSVETAGDRMRRDWEQRAEADPLYHISAGRRHWTLAEFYADGENLAAKMVDPALAELGRQPSGTVLEIGCGMGRLFKGLSDRFDAVWGIDISPTMVEKGKQECPVSATWFVGDGLSLSGIPDASVSHVLSFEVFQHIPDRAVISSYHREIMRVLEPTGTFQVHLRSGSDSKAQAVVRAMPRPLRVGTARLLHLFGILPVVGDIDSWLGAVVPPTEARAEATAIGFTALSIMADEIHDWDMGYWLLGRRDA